MSGEEFLKIIVGPDHNLEASSQNDIVLKVLSDIPDEVDITRKQAAIIIHEYIKKVLHEADTTDVEAAKELKDLYDCRICVQHIEQVYCKGIMRPMIDKKTSIELGIPMLFGGNELITVSEAMDIATRVNNNKKTGKL